MRFWGFGFPELLQGDRAIATQAMKQRSEDVGHNSLRRWGLGHCIEPVCPVYLPCEGLKGFPGSSFPCFLGSRLFVKNEKSAQRGSFRAGYPADIRGSFARISRPKTSVRALKILEKNKHLGADIHDPKVRTSTTLRDFQKLRSEKLWAEFSFPISGDLQGHVRWTCPSGPDPLRTALPRPDLDPILIRKGRFQVKIRSKSGLRGGVHRGLGQEGVGPAGMAPESLDSWVSLLFFPLHGIPCFFERFSSSFFSTAFWVAWGGLNWLKSGLRWPKVA